ncbi:hypothetical protein BGZ80_001490 [Entomortierella chlamydospora]|uniref:Uncharacterized protein n=1 Tax=Entomortierella chlamydospora TaxID=101097 RepID=A0A9P6N294_9FUNG|nr:hypothetical protein BGZ80_001490 [Entomortierella chlamydospora]
MARSSAGSGTFVNPYIAYVAEIDPDGTMDDGRAYVGGAAHYVDKPQTKSKPPTSSNMKTAPLSSKPSTTAVQNQGSFKQSGPPTGSSGRHRPGRLERGFADSRWSGQALATAADMLPDGFFGTAKPAVTSSQRNPSRYEDSPRTEPPQTPKTWQAQSNEWGTWGKQPQSGSIPQSESRNPPPQPHQYVSRTQPEPRDSSQLDDYQRGASWDQPEPASMTSQENSTDLYRAKQAPETVPPNPSGHENEYIRTQTSMSRSQPVDQSFGSSRRGSMRSTGFPSQGYAYESDSESSSTFRSQLTSLSRDATQKPSVSSMSNIEPLEQTPPQNQGNPLFLQYPIGDGCHAIVAIYVEKDAQSAVRRFPGIERTRLESSRRDKTLDEMAVIFKEALEDEKKSLIG